MKEFTANNKTVLVEGSRITYLTAEGSPPLNVEYYVPEGDRKARDAALLDFLETWCEDDDLIAEVLDNWRGPSLRVE